MPVHSPISKEPPAGGGSGPLRAAYSMERLAASPAPATEEPGVSCLVGWLVGWFVVKCSVHLLASGFVGLDWGKDIALSVECWVQYAADAGMTPQCGKGFFSQ